MKLRTEKTTSLLDLCVTVLKETNPIQWTYVGPEQIMYKVTVSSQQNEKGSLEYFQSYHRPNETQITSNN